MRLQTDQEFKQRKIFDFNRKYNVNMFSTAVKGGNAFTANQKLNKFLKRLSKLKAIKKNKPERNYYCGKYEKFTNKNINIENKTLNSEVDGERYNFTRILKIGKEKAQHKTSSRKIYSRKN